jgi:hypothetical protein
VESYLKGCTPNLNWRLTLHDNAFPTDLACREMGVIGRVGDNNVRRRRNSSAEGNSGSEAEEETSGTHLEILDKSVGLETRA